MRLSCVTNMEMQMNEMDDLLARYMAGDASAEDRERLNRWLAEDERNLRYFYRYRSVEDALRPAFSPEDILTERALRRVCPSADRRRVFSRWGRVAAVALLALGGVLFRYLHSGEGVEGGKVSVQEPTAFARASSAVLVLPSGERIVLDGQTDREVDAEGETVARTSGQSISYTEANRLPSEPVYHELHIPRGREFFLTLSDGSRVWLNADTKVRYPLYFAGGERKIYVEGEVYLEVAHREASPFRVVTPACDVTVLGTHFNVSAYPDASSCLVTLAEGRVRVTPVAGGEPAELVPGEQAEVADGSDQVVTRQVDPDLYCGWHDGRLIFRNNSLEEILGRLSRQYDVRISWEDESLKGVTFSGELARYEQVERLLELMAKTQDVKFVLREKEITVKRP